MMNDGDLALGLEPFIVRFDHVSMAVRDIDAARPFVSLVGGEYLEGGFNTRDDFRWAQYRLSGGAILEMIAPNDPHQSDHFLNRFLASRGEGLHHITLRVTDLQAAVAAATRLGFTVVGINDSDPDWKEAFIHPRSAHGVLVQIAQSTE
ncbi:MAG: VOC family protein [Acidimicrobiia bacterium]